ncbi:MAG: MSHA biogenesis protein MshN [Enterobacterales bacterium]|jgi:MSHA biogenesis protein MshN
MSVINQMLKNLDERKRENKTPETREFLSSQYQSGQKISLVKMISLVIFIVFLVVLITAVTIYKFDIFNVNQDTIIVSPIPVKVSIKQKNKFSESNNKIDEVKQKNTGTNVGPNVQTQNSSSIINTVIVKPIVKPIVKQEVKQEAKQETKPIELPSKAEIQDLINPVPETTKVIKTTVKINLKAQSEKLFNQAQSSVDRGDVSKAKKQLSKALDANFKNHKARLLLLRLLLENGNLAEMQKHLDTSLNTWPNVNEYRQLQARLYLEKGDKQQALSLLQQEIPSVEISVDYHALLAFVAQQSQKDSLASKHFQLLLQFNNSRADWWLGFAVSEERLGNNEQALQAYNQSIRRTGLSETVKNYARQRIKLIQGY